MINGFSWNQIKSISILVSRMYFWFVTHIDSFELHKSIELSTRWLFEDSTRIWMRPYSYELVAIQQLVIIFLTANPNRSALILIRVHSCNSDNGRFPFNLWLYHSAESRTQKYEFFQSCRHRIVCMLPPFPFTWVCNTQYQLSSTSSSNMHSIVVTIAEKMECRDEAKEIGSNREKMWNQCKFHANEWKTLNSKFSPFQLSGAVFFFVLSETF